MFHLQSGHILSKDKTTSFSDYQEFRENLVTYIEDFSMIPRGTVGLDTLGRLRVKVDILERLSRVELHVHHVNFPGGSEGEKLFSVFECMKSVRFTQCTFSSSRVILSNPKVSFFDCKFTNDYDVLDMHLRDDNAYDDCLYQRCKFYANVRCGSYERKGRLVVNHSLFADCKFKGRVVLENLELKGYFLDVERESPSEITRLKAKNCIFNGGFYVNSQKMKYAFFDSCVFKGKFEFKENILDRLSIQNCNFERVSDLYGSSISRFLLRKSTFNMFVGFEECHFQRPSPLLPAGNSVVFGRARFIYVTFMQFASFRGASFHGGVDLEKINTIEQPNFHRVHVAFQGTKRETFRLIKHALDSHGAHIEANKFFALEMRRRQQELSEVRGLNKDKVVYFLNYCASNFGQNYVRPLFGIVVLALIFKLLRDAQQSNLLYTLHPPFNTGIKWFSVFVNDWASGITPFKQFLHPGMECISLVFYVAFAVLIWQVIVSLKRLIRR